MVDVMKTANLFKFGFETAEDRNWALVNGPWCIRGYTLVLHAWSPSVDGPITLNVLRVWIQIHNLPHEYFSRENGHLLRGLVGKVVKVDLEDDKPATWSNFLKILVDIDVQKPLVSGCFFDLISGEKQWLQVKYVKICIFCYKCGCLGHQRRGCKLSSTVTVAKNDGVLFPSPSSMAKYGGASSPLLKFTAVDGDGSKDGSALKVRRPRHPVNVTSRAAAAYGKSQRAMWFPKQRIAGVERGISIPSMGGESGALVKRKGSDHLSVLRVDEVDRSLDREDVLENIAVGKSALVGGPFVGSGLSVIGPSGQKVEVEKGLLQKDKFSGPSVGLGLCVSSYNKDSGPSNMNCFINTSGPELGATNINVILSLEDIGGPIVSNKVSPCIGPVLMEHTSGEQLGLSSSGPTVERVSSMLPNEDRALAQFFKAQEELMNDLKHFGKLDLYEIRRIGGDIGVPASSEVNERTTPFKKGNLNPQLLFVLGLTKFTASILVLCVIFLGTQGEKRMRRN
ncbi:hypothetical protein F8388_020250 [Cannabis sativa]|uniref:CCHC-type domain-containing protein n=1 Tax=Cannabis sativa TaxID=3483 RepID=A0A7J6FYD4_CANSA|nr:hypothetical protein F8388_020250 [Cannabis sativa]